MSRLIQSAFLITLLNFSAQAQKPELILPVGHTEDIFSIQYSSRSKHILTCAHDNTAKVWDASSGKLLYTLDNLAHSIEQGINTGIITRFTQDGKFIVAIGNDNTLKKWETESGRLVYSTPDSQNKFSILRESCNNASVDALSNRMCQVI